MNTKFKIYRQVVLTVSVLLTAMWLPLSTFAQDFSKAGDPTQDTNTRAENCAYCQTKQHSHDLLDCQHAHDTLTFSPGPDHWVSEEIVGFAETDPAIQQSENVVAVPQVSKHLVQQVSAGFAETDPVRNRSSESVTALSVSNSPAQQVSVGFAETDPAVTIYKYFGEIQYQALVDCLERKAKGIDLRTTGFSSLN